MPYQTRRRLRRDLEGARTDRDNARAELRKAEAQYDNDRRQLGRQIADRDEEIARLKAGLTNARRILAHVVGSEQTIVPVVQLAPVTSGVDLVKRGGAA